MKKFKHLDQTCAVLLILAALNWGTVALFDFDFFGYYFGCFWYVPRIIFAVFGLAALYVMFKHYRPVLSMKKMSRSAPAKTVRRKRRKRKARR